MKYTLKHDVDRLSIREVCSAADVSNGIIIEWMRWKEGCAKGRCQWN